VPGLPGYVWAGAGTYLIKSTIMITHDNVGIIGAGPVWDSHALTTLTGWSGLTTPMVQIASGIADTQLVGNFLENLRFLCGNTTLSTSIVGLQCNASVARRVSWCSFKGFFSAINIDIDPTNAMGTGGEWSEHSHIYVAMPESPGMTTYGIQIGTNVSTIVPADVHHERWDNTYVSFGTGASPQYALHVGLADTHIFDNFYTDNGAPGSDTYGILWDYQFTQGWPGGKVGIFPSEFTFRRPCFNTTEGVQPMQILPGYSPTGAYPHRFYDVEFENGVPAISSWDNVIAIFNEPSASWVSEARLQTPTITTQMAYPNSNLYPVLVYVTANDASTFIKVGGGGPALAVAVGTTSTFRVPLGETIKPTWDTAPPTWEWTFAGWY
jgi:hypothetical protein